MGLLEDLIGAFSGGDGSDAGPGDTASSGGGSGSDFPVPGDTSSFFGGSSPDAPPSFVPSANSSSGMWGGEASRAPTATPSSGWNLDTLLQAQRGQDSGGASGWLQKLMAGDKSTKNQYLAGLSGVGALSSLIQSNRRPKGQLSPAQLQAMLKSKYSDWTPEQQQAFNAYFYQPLPKFQYQPGNTAPTAPPIHMAMGGPVPGMMGANPPVFGGGMGGNFGGPGPANPIMPNGPGFGMAGHPMLNYIHNNGGINAFPGPGGPPMSGGVGGQPLPPSPLGALRPGGGAGGPFGGFQPGRNTPPIQMPVQPPVAYARGGNVHPRGCGCAMCMGGRVGYAAGGYARGALVMGDGGGQSDRVPANLSPGEYVMDADVVSALGDGNNAAGAKKLDGMRAAVRSHNRSAPASKIPPISKSPLSYLKR